MLETDNGIHTFVVYQSVWRRASRTFISSPFQTRMDMCIPGSTIGSGTYLCISYIALFVCLYPFVLYGIFHVADFVFRATRRYKNRLDLGPQAKCTGIDMNRYVRSSDVSAPR